MTLSPLRPAFLPALLCSALLTPAGAASSVLLPAPAEFHRAAGQLAVTADFRVATRGPADPRLQPALARALRRWEERTGLTFARTAEGEFAPAVDSSRAPLVIDCAAASQPLPRLGEDESYGLDIDAHRALLRAPTTLGVLRGLETLLQILECTPANGAHGNWSLPAVSIRDQPRFPWRGLMIDVARHWQPLEVIKRNLDGMALVKLNVLHLHLSEDQGFRIESKTHPELHQRGSDGHYFTQEQIREIIAYAADRGIRVVPEFDIPGHATSWVVSHPELASAPGPYAIERRWGVFDPVLDPTNEGTYALLTAVLGEMAALFPDPYFHIGGDENNGKQWSANPHIQAFIREHQLGDNAGLHAYFNRRVHAILAAHGKRIVGWDEILHPDLPADSVVHSWRGAEGLADATQRGYATILSNGYYIDLCFPVADHYRNDPLPADSSLPPAAQARVLGGEATMWSEWATPETIDSRIWPRTAAIAERLWSPREVSDLPDLYRRLAIVGRRLEEAGLQHDRNRPAMIRRLAGDNLTPAELENLRAFVDLIEPVKHYARGGQQPDATQFTPLTGLADCARPESEVSRAFAAEIDAFLALPPAQRRAADLHGQLDEILTNWIDLGRDLTPLLAQKIPATRAAAPLASALTDAATIGLAAVDALAADEKKGAAWREIQIAALDRAASAHDAVLLPIIPALRRLVQATP